jgi:hypothetical protein
MQADIEAIDWSELIKFEDTGRFANWRLDQEEEPEWILSGEDVGWTNDSGSTYFGIADALQNIADDLPADQRDLLAKSYFILFAAGEEFTIQDIPCVPDSCYMFTLSPDRISEIHDSIKRIDRERIVTMVAGAMEDFEDDWIIEFFDQVDAVVSIALEKKWGIIGFAG